MFISNLFKALSMSFLIFGLISCSGETSNNSINGINDIVEDNGVIDTNLPVVNKTGVVTLSWTPPTENTDNSTLIDLKSYKIYYGLDASSLTESISISGAGITEYVIENLQTGVEYYFSITSINSSDIESPDSAIISKFISG